MRSGVLRGLVVAVAVVSLGGCAASQGGGSTSAAPSENAPAQGAAEAAESEWPQPPKSSKLSRVKPGMSEKEVRKLLGPPDDIATAMTGKAFIPYYFGNDAQRKYFLYKGMGQVIFASGNVFGGGGVEALGVYWDPKEDGVAE